MPATAEEIQQFKEFSGQYDLQDVVVRQFVENSSDMNEAITSYFTDPNLYTEQTVWQIDPRALFLLTPPVPSKSIPESASSEMAG